MLIHHKLADFSQYFTEDELSKYVDSYIQEGYFNQDGALYLFPVAKSTEITMLNKTDWEPFAEAAGTTVDELHQVIENLTDVQMQTEEQLLEEKERYRIAVESILNFLIMTAFIRLTRQDFLMQSKMRSAM